MADSSTFLFDVFQIRRGNTIYLTGLTGSNKNIYGGVIPGIERETFKESPTSYVAPTTVNTDIYDDVQGEFILQIKGPTYSGMMAIAKQIEWALTGAEDFYAKRSTIPAYFIGNGLAYGLIKEATFEMLKEDTAKRYDMIRAKIKYKRKPILTSAGSEMSIVAFSSGKRPFTPFVIQSMQSFAPVPTSFAIHLANAAGVFPSGFILTANQPIIAMSGTHFFKTGAGNNPAGIALFDETQNNPYSVYSAGTGGVLGWTPPSATTIITSGLYYGDASTTGNAIAAGRFTPYYMQADIYASVKTTFSGTAFYLSFLAESNSDNAGDVATDEVLVQNAANPSIYYLGRISVDKTLAYYNYRLKIRSSAGSGILLIDNVTVQPVTDVSNNAVLISKLNAFVNTPYNQTTVASGNVYLRVDSNYTPNLSSYAAAKFMPTANIAFYLGSFASPTDYGYVPATYRGSLAFYRQRHEFDHITGLGAASTSYYITVLATGSAYDTPSGLRYWTHSDRVNQPTNIGYAVDTGDAYTRFGMYG